MKVVWSLILIAALMATAGAVGYFVGHRSPAAETAAESDDAVEPVPSVRTAPIQQTRIEHRLTAYGVVVPQNGDVAILSVPFESRIRKILVIPGQRLDSESAVIEIEPSSDTQLQMLQAKYALQAAATDIQQTRQRYSAHLATNQDLLQSEQNMEVARLKLDSLEKQGAGGVQQLKASGLISKIDVQQGQVVSAGSPLVEVATGARIQIRLGVDPADAAALHLRDPVNIFSTDSSQSAEGKIEMISRRIDPDTHMIDLFVSLAPGAAMPLDATVRGEFATAAANALVVPRAAVLPDVDGISLFTVEHDKAIEHKVTLGVQNDDFVQINGDGLAPGEPVVILGNLELEDGMSVKTDGPPATQEAAP
jgi:RND family efflux transporter MFP subunit